MPEPATPEAARRLWIRAGLGLLLSIGWYAGAAPAVQEALHEASAGQHPATSPQELRARIGRMPPSLRLSPSAQAEIDLLLDQMERAWALESQWGARAAGLLDGAQRARAAEMSPADPPLRQTGSTVDPVLLGLTQAILDRYGYAEAPLPARPDADPWGDRPQQERIRRMYALLSSGELTEEQAHALLQLCLLQIQTQERRGDAEDRLYAIIGEARRAALFAPTPPV